MKRLVTQTVGVLFLILTALSATASLPAYAGLPFATNGEIPSLAPMLKKVMPAVVNISTRSSVPVQENPLLSDPFFRQFFNLPEQPPQQQEIQSLGSGVIVDAKHGYILTNNHVIKDAQSIAVILSDGRRFKAKVIGADPETDIAVIQIHASDLTTIPLGNSGKLEVGDFVAAIGNPFGLGQTVTAGIVSALGRTGLGIEGYEDFIQTDASINPGNSGGALVNLKGQIVGINTAIIAPSGGNVGIGFAIPINMARDIMEQLIKYGTIHRGQLGVYIQDLTPALAKAFGIHVYKGAVVTQVIPNSPAAKAGLKVGDVVTEANGQPIGNAADLRNAVGLLRIGQTITLKILRNGRPETIHATIATPVQSKLAGVDIDKRLAGAEFGNIPEGSPLYNRVHGVLVIDVKQGSPAWYAGLRKKDVIVSVNRQPVRNLNQLTAAAKRSPKSLLLNIQRGNGALFILIQ